MARAWHSLCMADGARLFLPGLGARPRMYAGGLPLGWEPLTPPPPRVSRGSLACLRQWAVGEIVARPGRTFLSGHSMGAALAMLAALTVPEHVEGLLLIAPAGLPLQKPVRRSAADLGRQLLTRRHSFADAFAAGAELAAAPRGAVRLVRALRRLDLSVQMARLRVAGIPTIVVGCSSDTLVTPAHCRRAATLLGARYEELQLPGGHVWMLDQPSRLASLLTAESP